jgi:hypothetical protein
LVLFDSFFGVGSAFGRGQESSGGYLVGPWEILGVPGGSYGVIGWSWVVLRGPWELPGSVLGALRRPTKYGCPLCRVSGQLSTCKKTA